MEQLQFQEMLLTTITSDVCQKYGISLQVFEMSNMANAHDPDIRTALQEMALNTMQGDSTVPETLTREKLREILNYTCDFIENYIRDNK
mmetsp:Transcript_14662/g.2411  ORF Transcript_14662/g.2411 Transcript_14662/m.2411 type:complete len:89 (-) Transcript_14662:266-532(-)